MDKFAYTFDFGAKPAFIIDAWFKRAFGPVLAISVIFFPLCAISSHWVTNLIFPSISIGAITIFVGIYVFRRHVAIRRVKNISNKVFRYKIDDLGICFENDLGDGVLKWGFKGKLIPLRKFILLQSNEIGLIPLPIDTPAEILTFIENKLRSNKSIEHDEQHSRTGRS